MSATPPSASTSPRRRSATASAGSGKLLDALFLKTPKGVVPTARAIELAEPVGEILARIRTVVATAAPFDPATSTRRSPSAHRMPPPP